MKTILVVEDEARFAHILENVLTDEGYQVSLAQNGQEALTLLSQCPVDMVISDVNMPVLDGIELCRELKNHSTYDSIPIVLMSSMPGIVPRHLCDYVAFITKAFSFDVLLQLVNEIIGK
jgi:CheY-like chemotaxis protein